MKIFAIRHGITDHNRNHILQGQQLNAGMNSEGIKQVQQGIKLVMRNKPIFLKIYSSPLLRAQQTAIETQKKTNLEVELREELLERDFGSLSGMTWDDIESTHGEALHIQDQALNFDYRPYGGESADQVRTRVSRFINELKELTFDNVLVTTHGGTMRIFYDVLGLAQPDHVKNGSVHIFEIQPSHRPIAPTSLQRTQ